MTKTIRPRFMVQWHITARCDQRCKHCYVVNNPEIRQNELTNELSSADCKKIIDSILELCRTAGASPSISFTGGDPLLRPDFWEILAYAKAKKIDLRVMGNPYHLTPESIKKLQNFEVRSYQVSLDGREIVHDAIRKPGSFRATVKAIKLLKRYGMKAVVMFTLSRVNTAELFGVMDLVSELEVDAFAFARLSKNLSPDGKSDFGGKEITPQEYRDLLLMVQRHIERLKRNGSQTHFTLKDHLWKLLLFEQGRFKLRPNPQRKVVSGCHIGMSNLTILADGTAYTCRRFKSPIGKMPEQSALQVFVSDKLDHYRQIQRFEKCSKCPILYYCRGCPAVAFGASGGNFFAPDPQCWRVND